MLIIKNKTDKTFLYLGRNNGKAYTTLKLIEELSTKTNNENCTVLDDKDVEGIETILDKWGL